MNAFCIPPTRRHIIGLNYIPYLISFIILLTSHTIDFPNGSSEAKLD